MLVVPRGLDRNLIACNQDRIERRQSGPYTIQMAMVARPLQHLCKDQIANQQPVIFVEQDAQAAGFDRVAIGKEIDPNASVNDDPHASTVYLLPRTSSSSPYQPIPRNS